MLVQRVQGLEQELEAKGDEATTMTTENNRLRDEVYKYEATPLLWLCGPSYNSDPLLQ